MTVRVNQPLLRNPPQSAGALRVIKLRQELTAVGVPAASSKSKTVYLTKAQADALYAPRVRGGA